MSATRVHDRVGVSVRREIVVCLALIQASVAM